MNENNYNDDLISGICGRISESDLLNKFPTGSLTFKDYRATLEHNIILCKDCVIRTRIYDCRTIGNTFVRRRECPKCKKRYNTKEVLL